MGDLLDDYDATGLAELVAAATVTPVELVEASIARIEAFDPRLNAVIHRQFDRALREAAGSLPDGPFRGVPILFKDFGAQEVGEPHHQGMRVLRDAGGSRPTTVSWRRASAHSASSRSVGRTHRSSR